MTNTRTSFSEDIPKGVARRNREATEINEMPMWTMIRSGKYKYITYTGDGFEEIYDLQLIQKNWSTSLSGPTHATTTGKSCGIEAADALRKTQSGFESGHFIDYFPHLGNLKPNVR